LLGDGKLLLLLLLLLLFLLLLLLLLLFKRHVIQNVKTMYSKFYLRNKSWKPECVENFNMDWRILVFYPGPEARDTIDYTVLSIKY
jgi:hypothetical protein